MFVNLAYLRNDRCFAAKKLLSSLRCIWTFLVRHFTVESTRVGLTFKLWCFATYCRRLMRNFCKRTNVSDISVTKFEYCAETTQSSNSIIWLPNKVGKSNILNANFPGIWSFWFHFLLEKVTAPILNSLQNREFAWPYAGMIAYTSAEIIGSS